MIEWSILNLPSGTVIDNCIVLSFVSKTLSSVVYRGTLKSDRRRKVAIKISLGDELDCFLERDAHILSILGKLDLKVPKFIDYGEFEGKKYLVSTWITGKDLQVLSTDDIKLKALLRIFLKICETLELMHNHNLSIAHGDLSLSSVINSWRGVYLIDFGISGYTGSKPVVNQRTGTPDFCAPEQFDINYWNKDIYEPDTRADIYSLGKILLYMLLPEEDRKDFDMWRSVDNRISVLPFQLQQILLRSVQKDPSDRYLFIEEMKADISKYLKSL